MSEPLKENKDEADWSKPPKVDAGAAEDFADRLDEPYEGMLLETAKKVFAEYGLSWATVGPKEFAAAIASLRSSRKKSDKLGPACFVFCDARIPKTHRPGWVLAVLAARDVHEDG
jgi:hypothetical protein